MHSQSPPPNQIARSSDRNFGFIMTAFFLILTFFPLLHHQPIRYWALLVAAFFFIPALVFPKLLSRLNILWMQFGELLSKIVSPIALGIVFFVAITPFALIMRVLGKRGLDLKFEPNCESYWKVRDVPGPDPKSMKDQF
ncbi:SxtJ family membrane protein [Undibacterium seohonense]|nr:SxtJ family membrane protein [Undibacterium seohonense]